MYELNTLRSECSYSWDDFYEWLKRIYEEEVPQTLPCVKSSLTRLVKKRTELSRNKRYQQLADLFKEPFFPSLKLSECAVESVDPAVVSKPSLSVRNVNKKLKRRDEKIKQYKSDIVSLSKENDILQHRLTSAQQIGEQKRVAAYRINQKMEMAATEKVHLESRIEEIEKQFITQVGNLEAKVHSLSSALDVAKAERDELADRVSQLESETVPTKQHGQLY